MNGVFGVPQVRGLRVTVSGTGGRFVVKSIPGFIVSSFRFNRNFVFQDALRVANRATLGTVWSEPNMDPGSGEIGAAISHQSL